ARAAEAVDGDARDRDRQAGAHRGKARDVLARGALGHGATEDHVLDLARLDAGARDRLLDHVAAEHGAAGGVERAAIGLTDRRAASRTNGGRGLTDLL